MHQISQIRLSLVTLSIDPLNVDLFVYLFVNKIRKNNMAIVTCRECSKEISDTASSCPHCGASKLNSIGVTSTQKVTAIIIILISIGLLGYAVKLTGEGKSSGMLVGISVFLIAYAIFHLKAKKK
jgi:RNA polymerase subunit RPABC4/transcription elongation factor Spt4